MSYIFFYQNMLEPFYTHYILGLLNMLFLMTSKVRHIFYKKYVNMLYP